MGERIKKPPILIMLSGKARSGKDTIAEIIRHEVELGIATYNHYFQTKVATLGFADILKAMCRRNHGYENKELSRDILLDVGDEMRDIYDDIFVSALRPFVSIYKDMGYGLIVITDTRYENEYRRMRDYSAGITYHVNIESDNAHNGVDEVTRNHPSENIDFGYDFKIQVGKLNKETYPALVSEIRRVVGEIIDDYKEVLQ